MAEEKEQLSSAQLVVQTLAEKSVLKQDVFANTIKVFEEMKRQLELRADVYSQAMAQVDERVQVEYSSKSNTEAMLRLAGDRLIFHMHTNVFKIDEASNLWRSSYLRQNELRGYCGIINVYNFLNDSFIHNRTNDTGYMIARLFVNAEGHFFVQGKRQLGFLYNDFVNSVITPELLSNIIDSAILYTLNFDLLTPPYDRVSQVRVADIQTLSDHPSLQTGKRLGFRFQADTDEVE